MSVATLLRRWLVTAILAVTFHAWGAFKCAIGLHCDRIPIRRQMNRAERRRFKYRRRNNVGIARIGEECDRCGKVLVGQREAVPGSL